MGRHVPIRPLVFALGLGIAGCAATGIEGETAIGGVAAPVTNAPAGSGIASYTAAQAERGRTVFNTVCSACHGIAEFRGRLFELTWMERPVGHFFEHISIAMPQDRPGSLSAVEYAAVVAYVLQLNGVAPAATEVSTDAAVLNLLRWRQ